MQRRNCNISSTSRSGNRGGRIGIVPVGSTNNNSVGTDIGAGETEVASGQGTIRKANITEVASNGTVKTNRVTRDAVKVVLEQSKTSVELFKNNGLGLYFADLFEDDPLCHFLEDDETLLDDLDGFGVADNLVSGFYDLGEVRGAVEVVDTVEIVEVIEGREITPVIEWSEATSS